MGVGGTVASLCSGNSAHRLVKELVGLAKVSDDSKKYKKKLVLREFADWEKWFSLKAEHPDK